MIVAWQFTARECVLKKIRPVGYGLTWSTAAFTTQGRRTFPPTQSYRSLTGRFGFFRIPGSKLPGYYHSVPSGQTEPCPHFRLHSTYPFEDEDDVLPLVPDGGSIILNASIAASMGLGGFSVYSATKAAVRSFSRSWTDELKGRKIRVNTLSPGLIDTPIIGKGGMTE